MLKFLQQIKLDVNNDVLAAASSLTAQQVAAGAPSLDAAALSLGQGLTSREERKKAKYRSYRILPSYNRSTAPRGKITAVSIGLFNPDDLLRITVVEVKEASTTYEKGAPRLESLFDLRMGTVDPDFECTTCSGSVETCNGHLGHISLRLPIYHVEFLMSVLRVLQCVCHSCSRFLLSDKDPRFAKIMAIPDGIKRLAEFARVCQTIDYCGGGSTMASSPAEAAAGYEFDVREFLKHKNKGCGAAQRVYNRNKLNIDCYERKQKESKKLLNRAAREAAAAAASASTKDKQEQQQKPNQRSAKKSSSGSKERKDEKKKHRNDNVNNDDHDGDKNKDDSSTSTDEEDGEDDDMLVDDDEEDDDENGEDDQEEDSDIGSLSSDEEDGDDEDEDDAKGRDKKKKQKNKDELPDEPEEDADEENDEDEEENDMSDEEPLDVEDDEEAELLVEEEFEDDVDKDDVDMEDGEEGDGEEDESSHRVKGGRKSGKKKSNGDGGDDDFSDRSSSSTSSAAAAALNSKAASKKRWGKPIAFTQDDALTILKRIDERDYEKLGFRTGSSASGDKIKAAPTVRPEFAIIRHLPVPPPCMRVNILTSGQGSAKARMETDATKHLKRIVGFNNQLKNKFDIVENPYSTAAERAKAAKDIVSLHDKLQKAVACYINSDAKAAKGASLAGHSKSPLKPIVQRWKSKMGRIRSNLVARRGDFNARTVIGPGTHQDIDQLGVPIYICMRLTYPEEVTPYNIHRLRKLVQRGPDIYPGANTIIKQNGEVIDLMFARNRRATALEVGMRVERHLIEGDIVLFGRQPSLHKMSIMAFRIFPHRAYTFWLNLLCTRPYNADFDGDEMWLGVPQNQEARAEAFALMMSHRQIPDPQDKACMGFVQDAQLASSLISDKNVFHTRAELMQFVSKMHYWEEWSRSESGSSILPAPAVLIKDKTTKHWKALWTGKQCVSMIFPRQQRATVQYTSQMDNLKAILADEAVCIEGSELLLGRLNKDVVGPTRGGIVQNVVHDFGDETARRFLSDGQRFLNYWIGEFGYGISVSDVVCSKEKQADVHALTNHTINYLKKWTHPNKRVRESYIKSVLEKLRDQTGLVVQRLPPGHVNRMRQMIDAGAKGSKINICQTQSQVGQILHDQERLAPSFGDGRSLPHFLRGTRDPAARGLVIHSFMEGMDAPECFMHAVGGRDGLVDTATKTARVGYLNRRLMRALEDLKVHWDGTVRDPQGIVCFSYGGDNFDTTWMETQHYPCMSASLDDIHRLYDGRRRLLPVSKKLANNNNKQQQEDEALRLEIEAIVRDAALMRQWKMHVDASSLSESIKAPVHFMRILRMARRSMIDRNSHNDNHKDNDNNNNAQKKKADSSIVPVDYVLQRVQWLIGYCEAAVKHPAALTPFLALLRVYLSSCSIIAYNKLDRSAFDWVIETVRQRFVRALAQSGEMVGNLAGQSVSEPIQQMTLNVFHLAGVGNKSASAGVPRMEELIRVSKKKPSAKTSNSTSLEVFVKPELSNNRQVIMSLIRQLKPLKIQQFVDEEATGVYFDPHPLRTVLHDDHDLVDMYAPLFDDKELKNMSCFVVRLVLLPEKLVAHDKTIDDVFGRMKQLLPSAHLWIKSPVNASRWVIRVRIKTNSKEYRKFEKKKAGKKRALLDILSADAAASSSSSKASLLADDLLKFSELQVMKQMLQTVLQTELHGIAGIQSATMLTQARHDVDAKTLKVSRNNELLIETRGSNLRTVMNLPEVDHTRILSTSAYEMERVLGIEAACTIMEYELHKVFANNASYVNHHHFHTLARLMTKTGTLVGLNRNAYHQDKGLGFMKRMSFEKIVRVLMDAGQLGEVDRLQNVVSNIIIGSEPPIGTATCTPLYDAAKVHANQENWNVTQWNNWRVGTRMMDPIEAEDLVRLIPSMASQHNPAIKLAFGSNSYHHARYREAIAEKNARRTVPDYSFLVSPSASGTSSSSSSSSSSLSLVPHSSLSTASATPVPAPAPTKGTLSVTSTGLGALLQSINNKMQVQTRSEKERKLAEQRRRQEESKRIHTYVFDFPASYVPAWYSPPNKSVSAVSSTPPATTPGWKEAFATVANHDIKLRTDIKLSFFPDNYVFEKLGFVNMPAADSQGAAIVSPSTTILGLDLSAASKTHSLALLMSSSGSKLQASVGQASAASALTVVGSDTTNTNSSAVRGRKRKRMDDESLVIRDAPPTKVSRPMSIDALLGLMNAR